jgi:hypothetical protein
MHTPSTLPNTTTDRSKTMTGLARYLLFLLPIFVLGQNENATAAEQPFRSFNSTP